MKKPRIGVLGATSLVGKCLLPQLIEAGYEVVAFSRDITRARHDQSDSQIKWQSLSNDRIRPHESGDIPEWICLAPVWVLPDHFPLLASHGAARVLALSSTSRFSKYESSDIEEQALARRLTGGEERLMAWAEENEISWLILRPTLIYGLGQDRNIAEMIHIIRRARFFPLFGRARGLRQPVHVRDVAQACMALLSHWDLNNRAYNLSGGEVLPYREMVARVFAALELPARFVRVPLWLFRLAVAVLRCLPRFKTWSAAMAQRMNQDLVFDHMDATRDFGFSPRAFRLDQEDLPK